jgi:uncharacterized protein YukE
MTEQSLIAPVTSTRQPWTGSSLGDSIQGLVEAIRSESWVDGVLSGAGLGVEVAATVMDPISALLANGLGWAMEYFEPRRHMLEELTGKPDVVTAHANTWNNMATELAQISTDLEQYVKSDMPTWTGEASDAYHDLMKNNVDAIGGLSATAAAMAEATHGAGGLVSFTRDTVRDLIADLVARVIVWAAEALLVITIPAVASQIAAAVVKWTGRILTYTGALVTSLTNLSKLLNG